jgi:hypothetical protein
MTAGPDGVRDPAPNTEAALIAVAPNGFSGSSVRPIVISFCSFTPAPTHGSGGRRLIPASRPARHRDPCRLGHPVVSHARSPVAARPSAVLRDQVRQLPAMAVSPIDGRGTWVHSQSLRDVWQRSGSRRSCRGRPGGGGRTPVHVPTHHQRPGHAGHLVGERHRGDLAWLALQQSPQPVGHLLAARPHGGLDY